MSILWKQNDRKRQILLEMREAIPKRNDRRKSIPGRCRHAIFGYQTGRRRLYESVFFKKVKVIQPIPEDDKIWFKHGWDKFFLRVTKEQFGLILKSFEERCAGAVRGEVIKRK